MVLREDHVSRAGRCRALAHRAASAEEPELTVIALRCHRARTALPGASQGLPTREQMVLRQDHFWRALCHRATENAAQLVPLPCRRARETLHGAASQRLCARDQMVLPQFWRAGRSGIALARRATGHLVAGGVPSAPRSLDLPSRWAYARRPWPNRQRERR